MLLGVKVTNCYFKVNNKLLSGEKTKPLECGFVLIEVCDGV